MPRYLTPTELRTFLTRKRTVPRRIGTVKSPGIDTTAVGVAGDMLHPEEENKIKKTASAIADDVLVKLALNISPEEHAALLQQIEQLRMAVPQTQQRTDKSDDFVPAPEPEVSPTDPLPSASLAARPDATPGSHTPSEPMTIPNIDPVDFLRGARVVRRLTL